MELDARSIRREGEPKLDVDMEWTSLPKTEKAEIFESPAFEAPSDGSLEERLCQEAAKRLIDKMMAS